MIPVPFALPSLNIEATGSATASYDASLISRFLEGEECAFGEIVMRYRSRMFQVAWRLLRNHADAEEVAQDTFIRAHRGLSQFRGESSLASWLHRITLNLARNRYWYFRRRRRHLTDGFDQGLGPDGQTSYRELIASEEAGPVHQAEREEFLALVKSGLRVLAPHQREILELRIVEQLSYEEIAARLRVHSGTVKSRIARARQNLRNQLAPSYADTGGGDEPGSWLSPERADGLVLMSA